MAFSLRIATFNLENLDDRAGEKPPLPVRIPVLRAALVRLRADVLCLQEVHSQQVGGQRTLQALEQLLEGTPYEGYQRTSTKPEGQPFYVERNLVILSRFTIVDSRQLMQQLIPAPGYRVVTAQPAEAEAEPVRWERPIQHIRLDAEGAHAARRQRPPEVEATDHDQWPEARPVHVADRLGLAEGYFLSSMKRVGQALEVRRLVDQIFDEDANALIPVGGNDLFGRRPAPHATLRRQPGQCPAAGSR